MCYFIGSKTQIERGGGSSMETIAIIVTICVFVGGILWYVITEPKRKEREKREKEEEKIRRQEEEIRRQEEQREFTRIRNKYRTLEDAEENGRILMTLYGEEESRRLGPQYSIVHIYFDTKAKKFVAVNEGKAWRKVVAVDTAFRFHAVPLQASKLTYQPAKTVYTGATVGGFHTGGFHTEEAHLRVSKQGKSGGGIVCCAVNGKNFPVLYIDVLDDLYKRELSTHTKKSDGDKILTDYFGKGKVIIPLIKYDYPALASLMLSRSWIFDGCGLVSSNTAEKSLDLEICERIANKLNLWCTNS